MGATNMGKGYLNSKSCFSLNCCFSSNWCFNPILFKTPLTSKDGISSSMGLSDFFENADENFLSENGSVYDIQSSSNNPISRSNNNYPHGEINNRSGSSEPFPDPGIHMPSGGDSNHIGDTGNGASSFEKGGTCDESGEFNLPNPAKGNDLPLRGDSKDQKSTDGDPALGDSKNQKPKDNDSDPTHSDDSDQTHLYGSDPAHSDDSNQTHLVLRATPPHIAALWVQCEDCLGLNYKRFLKYRNNMCEHCPYHFKMNSPERIEFLIDPNTWDPIDEDMASPDPDPYESDSKEDNFSEDTFEWYSEKDNFSKDPSEWDSEEDNFLEDPFEWFSEEGNFSKDPSEWYSEEDNFSEERSEWDSEEDNFSEDPSEWDSEEGNFSKDPSEWDSEEEKGKSYEDRLDSYRRKTGLNEAVQTGVGQLNGIPAAFGIMEFEFMGGSMGSVVGEKIARLVEYATNQSLPLIIVCASGGARVQEGSLSLMQMAKISSALLDYDQSNNKLLYISILASPTTGGVTASFGTLADIVIAEPNSYIAFAGKRVIEELLKEPVPEGSQEAEPLFEKGILDLIIPRKLLKDVLTEFLKFHSLNPLNSNSIK
uniref:Acetyl-coenzyme A carboxylase carboxyl transferase subunit beta, chloroplastic n=2 Tax=Adenocalymma TaxID=353917 RepID=A0A2P1GGT9_9LAMI|nr:acetyl-CoA carboxylase carboxyltransferase beta subunit [Adenocalymma peregrinum]ATY48401.1 acetyl-CoA carboxylase carboxyltransferase beta subunit [Adenocalymma peregrinum]AVM84182.1 acetyl-CoA carboxylase carboxyltransferase beta subunit [Adenocalymma pubescens]